ncbi:MAG: DUF1441 family protein [Phycisphaerales bacterium]
MASKAKDPVDRADDPETAAIIYEGATIRQLALMFKMDPKVVMPKVSSLVPVGRRRGTAIYSIPEAAARLVKPGYEIERVIMNMNHSDLPPMLQNAFWSAQKTRASYEEMIGDLWRTSKVVRLISVLFNSVRMILLLLPDTIEREAGLSREQKQVVRRVVEGALVEGRKAIMKEFEDYGDGPEPDGDSGPSGPLRVREHESLDDGRDRVLAPPEVEDEYNGL